MEIDVPVSLKCSGLSLFPILVVICILWIFSSDEDKVFCLKINDGGDDESTVLSAFLIQTSSLPSSFDFILFKLI